MATVSKSVLGKISGAVGDVTFRQMNGKSFVGIRPVSFIPGSDAASLARRGRFSLSIKAASAVNSSPLLKGIWAAVSASGASAYNEIMKKNYQSIGSEDLSGTLVLVPGIGFNPSNPVVTLNGNDVSLHVDALGAGSGIDLNVEKTISAVSVFYLSGPEDDTVDKSSIISLVSEPQTLVLDSPLSFIIPLSTKDSQLIAKYGSHKCFGALITLDAEGKAAGYSNTFAG